MYPPKRAVAFLRWFCREDYIEEIEGDLREIFKKEYHSAPAKAKLKFILSVIRYFRPQFIKPLKGRFQPNTFSMYKSYFKIGWRNLLREKGYSLINIGGLAIGMAFALLVGLWIQYELSFDAFHNNGDRIALVLKNTLFNDERNTQRATPFPLSEELKNSYPEVKRASKVSWETERSLAFENNTFNKTGIYVDPDFLEMFSFRLLRGNVKSALNDPNSIILTQSLAVAMFGHDDPIGKTVKVNNEHDVHVTGIIEDVPANSTLKFNFLAPYEFEVRNSPFIVNSQTNWGNNFLMNVVELEEGVSMEAFSEKISRLNMEKDNRQRNTFLFLHPLEKWHLENDYKNWTNTGGRILYVRLFAIIGIFVLLIACVNFMNLSTARSQKRAKEVGIRKTIGSKRTQIIGQFLSESILTSCIAFLASLLIVFLILPYLSEFGFRNIKVSLDNSFVVTLGLAVCIATGIIAGSYPAFYLSSFKPVDTVKGMIRSGRGPVTFRRLLVVSQFAISIALIVSTIAVFQQVNHAKNRSIGYNPDRLISVRPTNELVQSFPALKQELLGSGFIEAVATASGPMTAVYNKWSDFSWDGKEPGADIALEALMTEWDFEKVAQLNFTMGRPFSIEHATDSNAVILNESALKVIGYKNPIGRTMKSGDRELTIVGVIEDMLMLDPFRSTSPGVILFNAQAVNAILVRVKDHVDLKTAMAEVDPIIRKYNASQAFVYSFVSEDFNKKFDLENRVGKLSAIFAVLAIFISCLGLFGLTSFMVQQRVKEIGIRKILGASVASLWNLLSKEFMVLIAISFAIAGPVVYYLVEQWLENYQYRTTVSLWTFAAVGAGVLAVALSTVSYQSLKAVRANPVKSLRTE